MTSSDANERREAIGRAVEQGEVHALPRLYKVDLAVDGYEAAAAIGGVGKLSALLPVGERVDAVRTLARWLGQESRRQAPGALGNAVLAIEALGETKSPAAAQPLIEALDGAQLPLHVETRIVQALGDLDAREAAPAVRRFVDRVGRRTPTDDFEKQLCAEALVEAGAVLKKLGAP